jgi:RNA-directed DNA polymerase
VRYADDFITSGSSKEMLEEEVKPVVVAFLKERGLELSEHKSHIVSLNEGFDFLGFTIRKYAGKLLTKPSHTSITSIRRKIHDMISTNLSVSATRLLVLLNPVIRGWANHFKHGVSKKVFDALSHYTWQRLWNWARRKHPSKNARWVRRKYFTQVAGNHWVFTDGKGKTIFNPSKVPIRRHVKIRAGCNPYDREWEEYVEQRWRQLARNVMTRKVVTLWMRQEGKCPWCKGALDLDNLHIHHIVFICNGGDNTLMNLQLVHDVCHRQIHAHSNDKTEAGGFAEEAAYEGLSGVR